MTAVLNSNDNANEAILYMALELSNKAWKLGFSDGAKQRQVTIEAGNWLALHSEIDRAREKFNLAKGCRIVSCYEAGRDGFWIHRRLLEDGIDNLVLDSASIEVNRRSRRAKTDSVDVKSLLRLLMRYWQGEQAVMSVVRVPTVEHELYTRHNGGFLYTGHARRIGKRGIGSEIINHVGHTYFSKIYLFNLLDKQIRRLAHLRLQSI